MLIKTPTPSLGLTITQTWNTLNALETKIEHADYLTKGLKFEGAFSFLPETGKQGAKVNVHFKQPKFHVRAFTDLLKGPTANIDAVIGHEGYVVGGSAGYDVQKAGITTFAAAMGYQAPTWTAAITATDKCSVFAASYYHKVNPMVEAGAKASWDSKTPGSPVGLEVATKYRLDAASFAKVSFAAILLKDLIACVGKFTDRHEKNRARSTTAVLPLSPTTSSSALVSLSALVPLSIPRSWTRPPTRYGIYPFCPEFVQCNILMDMYKQVGTSLTFDA